ncbi:hypothetical protein QVD17_30305 [Tagetes erecta]|uniref:DDT domain-containing protein n=1 Tax=Tagetes erecta TaxID=13708 RepID=A0AAD8NM48_TARER|nr:hypothetical protein QVD17_30305 [Tagetes erecta]
MNRRQESQDFIETELKEENEKEKEQKNEPERKLLKESDDFEEEKSTTEGTSEDHNMELQLPQGTELTKLAGIDLPSGDIGHALQLLEFCETFGEVLQLNNGEPEILLNELTSGDAHNTNESLIVQIHTRLLSLTEESLERRYSGNSWLENFTECISVSQYPSKESFLELFNLHPNGYGGLNFSQKLRLLNFLCDEALGLKTLRLWIEQKNVEEKKKAKERLIANRGRN